MTVFKAEPCPLFHQAIPSTTRTWHHGLHDLEPQLALVSRRATGECPQPSSLRRHQTISE